MDFWMLTRSELKDDLLDIFSALGDLQYRYDWVITDHMLWYSADCPDEVRRRWQWTGLLMGGQELTGHLTAKYVHFVWGGVLSAVPTGTRVEQIQDHVPYWDHEKLFSAEYAFQTPLTQLELICYDGYAWLIVCDPAFSRTIRRALPQALPPAEYFAALRQEAEASPPQ